MSYDFSSDQPSLLMQAEVWNDTVLLEDDLARDIEAFQADLLSLVDEVGSWVVYFKG